MPLLSKGRDNSEWVELGRMDGHFENWVHVFGYCGPPGRHIGVVECG